MQFIVFFIAVMMNSICYSAASSSSSSDLVWGASDLDRLPINNLVLFPADEPLQLPTKFSVPQSCEMSRQSATALAVRHISHEIRPEVQYRGRFFREAVLLRRKLLRVVHPLLHGSAEMHKKGLFGDLKAIISTAGERFWSGDTAGAFNAIKGNQEIWNQAKGAVSSVLNRWLGSGIDEFLFGENFHKSTHGSSGPSTIQALLDAENGVEKEFPNWNKKKTCPCGILKCPKLGANSKALLTGIECFFNNIIEYEKTRGRPFFTEEEEIDRLMIFLNSLTQRICQENVVFAALNKEGGVTDDKELKPYIHVVNYLIAIPTKVHNVGKYYKKNIQEIDKLLSCLHPNEQRELYEYIGVLIAKSEDPDYGYNKGDAGIHMLFSGATGTGKTFIAMNILRLLGFPLIKVTMKELQEGQDKSYNDIESLIDSDRLSGIETKLLRLRSGRKRGIGRLNHVLFTDEAESGKKYSITALKDQFDQFKKWHLPSLDITLPAFLCCIFTSNVTELISCDLAMRARFRHVMFSEMDPEKKIEILASALIEKIKYKPHLVAMWNRGDFNGILRKYVTFDIKRANLRVLLANIDSVIFYFEREIRAAAGEIYLLPPSERFGSRETFEEFLKRLFGTPAKSTTKNITCTGVESDTYLREDSDSPRFDTSADESFGDDYGAGDSE